MRAVHPLGDSLAIDGAPSGATRRGRSTGHTLRLERRRGHYSFPRVRWRRPDRPKSRFGRNDAHSGRRTGERVALSAALTVSLREALECASDEEVFRPAPHLRCCASGTPTPIRIITRRASTAEASLAAPLFGRMLSVATQAAGSRQMPAVLDGHVAQREA